MLPNKLQTWINGWVQNHDLYAFMSEIRRSLREFNRLDRRFISLKPTGSVQGSVLFSYINDPFFLPPGESISRAHTHHWESLQLAKTFLELGYEVDVIRYSNNLFVPRKDYVVFIDARFNLERISRLLNKDCIKIMHADTAHWLFHNAAEARRLLELQKRRGVALRPRRYIQPNWALEHADCVTVLGNEFTINTYRYANKPIYRIPISTAVLYPWPEAKNFEAIRKRYLWFGSGGLVHKGLDLVLDAFARMPDYHLTICGPIRRERDFQTAFYKELYETPNIHTLDWVDVGSPHFIDLANQCVGLVYPSCSEGGGGSVLTCMHAGLIPVVSYESSVDIDPKFGLTLTECSVDTIQSTVRKLSDQPADELRSMARQAWEFAREHHTREIFADVYRKVIAEILKPG